MHVRNRDGYDEECRSCDEYTTSGMMYALRKILYNNIVNSFLLIYVYLRISFKYIVQYGWNHLNIICTSYLRSRISEGVRRCSIADWRAHRMTGSSPYSNVLKNLNNLSFSEIIFTSIILVYWILYWIN